MQSGEDKRNQPADLICIGEYSGHSVKSNMFTISVTISSKPITMPTTSLPVMS